MAPYFIQNKTQIPRGACTMWPPVLCLTSDPGLPLPPGVPSGPSVLAGPPLPLWFFPLEGRLFPRCPWPALWPPPRLDLAASSRSTRMTPQHCWLCCSSLQYSVLVTCYMVCLSCSLSSPLRCKLHLGKEGFYLCRSHHILTASEGLARSRCSLVNVWSAVGVLGGGAGPISWGP